MARPIARDHDDKRRLILSAAAQVFADEGFNGASVSKVAAACQISKANIYHYYTSKDALLFDILNSHLSGLRDRVCQLDLSGFDNEAKFRATVVEILLAYQGADDAHRLQGDSIRYLPADQRALLRSHQRDLVHHLSTLILALAPDALGADKAKLHAITMSVFGMLNWFYMWNKNADKRAREDYAKIVCDLCLRGVSGV